MQDFCKFPFSARFIYLFIRSFVRSFLHTLVDELDLPDVPKGSPGAGKSTVHPINYDTSSAEHILGLRYTSMAQCVKDMTTSLRARGW